MFCSAAKVMENNFDNKWQRSEYKYKWFISTFFDEKQAALVNGHELSGKNFDPASSMQFDSSCSFLYFSSLAVSKVIHGIWIRLHHGVIWFLLIRYSGSTRHSLESTRLPSHPQLSTGSGLRNIIASSAACVMRGQKMHDNRKTWGTLPNI